MKPHRYLFFVMILSIISLVSCPSGHPEESKLLVVGLDAASWNILNPMIEAGYLPTISEILKTGTRARMKTLSPTVSVMLWTTIATGTKPEKHGITSWLSEGSDTSGQLSITSSSRKVKAIWNLDLGRRVLVSNWWASWPAESIQGVMISNRAHFPDTRKSVNPPLYSDAIRSIPKIGKNDLETTLSELNPLSKPLKLTDFTFSQLQRDIFYLDAAESLMEKENYQVVMVFVRGMDILGHEYLHDVISFQNAPVLPEEHKGIYTAYCRYLDKRIAGFMKRMQDNLITVLVSDHGMEPVTELPPYIEGLNLDQLLVLAGIEKTKEDGNPDPSNSILRDNKNHPPGLIRGISLMNPNGPRDNQTDRQIKDAAEILNSIQIDGQPLFTSVEITEDPNEIIRLTLNPKPGFNSMMEISGNQYPIHQITSLIIHPRAGQHWHAPDGIFAISGPYVHQHLDIGDIQIVDILPTLLYRLNQPIADELDGKPILGVFEDSFIEKHPVQHIQSYGKPVFPEDEAFTMEESETIKKELRTLGYIQ